MAFRVFLSLARRTLYIKDQGVIKEFWPIFFEFLLIQLPFITAKLPPHVTVIHPGSPISMVQLKSSKSFVALWHAIWVSHATLLGFQTDIMRSHQTNCYTSGNIH